MKRMPLTWKDGEVRFLDQRKLPHQEVYVSCRKLEDYRRSIADMVVRGALLIGMAAMWGRALWLNNHSHRIIVDRASSCLMRENSLDAIFVGADRIAANGDTANKIGTSLLAMASVHCGIFFYVAAPRSSFDKNAETGRDINIELRGEEEVLRCGDVLIAPAEAHALNSGFDITEKGLIRTFLCEKGVICPVEKNEVKLVLG